MGVSVCLFLQKILQINASAFVILAHHAFEPSDSLRGLIQHT